MANNQLISQADALPDPLTTCWAAKRPFTTSSTLPLPQQAGHYHLHLGWYWFPTLERLPQTNGNSSYNVEQLTLPAIND